MASRGFYLCVQRIQFKESSVARLPPPPGAQFHPIAPPKSSFNRSEPQHPLRQSDTHPGLIVIPHPDLFVGRTNPIARKRDFSVRSPFVMIGGSMSADLSVTKPQACVGEPFRPTPPESRTVITSSLCNNILQ